MTRQKTQMGITFIHGSWRALVKGFALLLLFTYQSWAGVVCNCGHRDGAERAGCHTAQRADSTAHSHHQQPDAHSSAHTSSQSAEHCSGKAKPVSHAQLGNLPQNVMLCCQVTPPGEAQEVADPAPNPAPLENTLPPIRVEDRAILASACITAHQHPSKRPLYLSFSCWLI